MKTSGIDRREFNRKTKGLFASLIQVFIENTPNPRPLAIEFTSRPNGKPHLSLSERIILKMMAGMVNPITPWGFENISIGFSIAPSVVLESPPSIHRISANRTSALTYNTPANLFEQTHDNFFDDLNDEDDKTQKHEAVK